MPRGNPGAPRAAARERPGGGLPEALGVSLLGWYRRSARDLPWRRTDDPYEILVSEFMLQQTRVETVCDRWARFLERFPTLEALADADVDDVLAEWSGLGYYRRARALHELARTVTSSEDGGTLPSAPEALRALPGVGPYTAAAVGSIAFGVPAMALDGNVMRVLCRLAAIEEDPRTASVRRRLEALVAPLLDEHHPGDLNQALMELGARVCTPRAPGCDDCPCERWCAARAASIEESIPPSRRQPARLVVEAAALIEDRGGRFLLLRGQRPGTLQDMWEFPTLDSRLLDEFRATSTPDRPPTVGAPQPSGRRADDQALRGALGRYLSELGVDVELEDELGTIRHGITTRRITCRVFRASPSHRAARGSSPRPRVGEPARARQTDGDGSAASPDADRAAHPGPRNTASERAWFTAAEALALPLATSARRTIQSFVLSESSLGDGREPS